MNANDVAKQYMPALLNEVANLEKARTMDNIDVFQKLDINTIKMIYCMIILN